MESGGGCGEPIPIGSSRVGMGIQATSQKNPNSGWRRGGQGQGERQSRVVCRWETRLLIQMSGALQFCPLQPSDLFPALHSTLCNSGSCSFIYLPSFPGRHKHSTQPPALGASESCRGTADEMLSDVDPLYPLGTPS